MPRPTLTDLAAGQLAAEATINGNHVVLTGGPFPIVVYTVSTLPAAGADNVNCLAVTSDTDELWHSDGSAWRIVGGDTGHIDAFGARAALKKATQLVTLNGNPSPVTWSGAFPDGCIKLGVSGRVTTTATGTTLTDLDIGDGTTVDLYVNALALAAGTTFTPADHTASPLAFAASAGDVVVTGVGLAGNFTAGAIRLVVYYLQLTAPTS